MKNIETIKRNFTALFAKEYYQKDSVSDLTEAESSVCLSIAEFWAYVTSVVPDEHSHYTIFDFMGYTLDKITNEKDVVLSPSVALFAKNQVCQFCWGMDWKEVNEKTILMDKKSKMAFLRKHSQINKRHKLGNNVVIYGRSQKPIGRTMIASIIMKEAIKLRISRNARRHTYDWIDFNTLVEASRNDTFDLADYKSCDFLVIDNIIDTYRTAKQNTFIVDLIDPFFIGRFNNHLPTILVLKFDINDPSISIEKSFGVGMNKIIESNRTYKIPLIMGEKIKGKE
jgi:hypothetical protein